MHAIMKVSISELNVVCQLTYNLRTIVASIFCVKLFDFREFLKNFIKIL